MIEILRRPLSVSLLGLGVLACLSGAAVAQPAQTGSADGQNNLTPNQKHSLTSVRDRYEARRQDIAMRLQQRRLELANLLRRDDPVKPTIQAKLGEIMELERERQELFIDEIFDAKAQMKPAQWRAFRDRLLRPLVIGPSPRSSSGR
jgi:hypothetical protein